MPRPLQTRCRGRAGVGAIRALSPGSNMNAPEDDSTDSASPRAKTPIPAPKRWSLRIVPRKTRVPDGAPYQGDGATPERPRGK